MFYTVYYCIYSTYCVALQYQVPAAMSRGVGLKKWHTTTRYRCCRAARGAPTSRGSEPTSRVQSGDRRADQQNDLTIALINCFFPMIRANTSEKKRRNRVGRSIEEIILSRSLIDPLNPSSWPDVKKSAKLILPRNRTKAVDNLPTQNDYSKNKL